MAEINRAKEYRVYTVHMKSNLVMLSDMNCFTPSILGKVARF